MQREVATRLLQWQAERRDRMLRWAMRFAMGGFAAIMGSSAFPQEIGWLVATTGLIALFFAYAFNKLAG